MKRDRIVIPLLVAAWTAGALLRLDGISTDPLFGDEWHSLEVAARPFAEIFRSFDDFGSHVALPLAQRICADLFGSGVASLRLVALVPGLASLALVFALGRRLVGVHAATLATVLLALSPIHVFYSRLGRGYALAAFGVLGLVALLERDVERDRGTWGRRGAAILVGGLVPWVHLSSGAVVAVLFAVAILRLLVLRRSRANVAGMAASSVAAALLALALYVPVLEPVRAYLDKIGGASASYEVDVASIASILAGGRVAAWALFLSASLGAAALVRQRPVAALWILAACGAPILALCVATPQGYAYAFARYLLGALPFLLLLSAAFAIAVARALAPRSSEPPAGARWGLAVGVAVAIAFHLAGPLSPWRQRPSTFRNTYLALECLPAFDEPFPSLPAVYRELASDDSIDRIVVFPVLRTRAVQLYRNYALAHGKAVLLLAPETDALRPAGPYVTLEELASGTTGADVVVLHHDIKDEVRDYWRFVFDEAWPTLRRAGDEHLMERNRNHRVMASGLSAPPTALFEALGEPDSRDRYVTVWRL